MKRRGFTLVELALAMTFLSVLLITIAILVIQIVGIYQKGLSVKAVNSVGRSLIDDMSRSVARAPIIDDNNVTTASEMISNYSQYFSQRAAGGQPVNGVFCTGEYSYMWNTGYAINENTNKMSYRVESGSATNDFRLVRVLDRDRSVCSTYNSTNSLSATVTVASGSNPVELLPENDSDLALYDFRVFPVSYDAITGQAYYSATFVLATLRGGPDIFASGDYCQNPSDGLSTDFAYCAVNKFNFAMRATGQTIVE